MAKPLPSDGAMPIRVPEQVPCKPSWLACPPILRREGPLGRTRGFVETPGPRPGASDADLGWRDFFDGLLTSGS